jgi:hypothetical protein
MPNAWRPITVMVSLHNVISFGRTSAPALICRPHRHIHHRLSVSFIFGAAGTSSDAATTGGLVASGEGTCNEVLGPKPSELLRLGVNGGGLLAVPDAEAETGAGVAGGCVPELNSAQRGHLRFVSEKGKGKKL